MSSVCIVAPSSLRYVPYLEYYRDAFDAAGVPHDVLLWDRFATGEGGRNIERFDAPGTRRGLWLIPGYLAFRAFLRERIRARPYDLLVLLGTQMGVLLYDLVRRLPYVLDIRDFSHEGFPPYRHAVFELIRRARLVCISSEGFREWLPAGRDYVMSHNVSRARLRVEPAPFVFGRRVISSIGALGYFDANARFLEGAAREPGWDVRYIGRGTCERELEAHVARRRIANVRFFGAFRPADKGTFYDEANFVLGIYDAETPVGRTLTPNRLYEACAHSRPLLVNAGTHLADVVSRNGLGVVLDLAKRERWDRLLEPYASPQGYEAFGARARGFVGRVEADIEEFENRLRSVLRGDVAAPARHARNPR